MEFIIESTNLFNRLNYLRVNDVIDVGSPLVLGPYNVKGDPTLAPTAPLAFTAAFPGRQIQFGLKLGF